MSIGNRTSPDSMLDLVYLTIGINLHSYVLTGIVCVFNFKTLGAINDDTPQ